MLRKLIQMLTDFIAWIKRRRKVNTKNAVRACSGSIKINIGCGLSVAPGWINIDSGINTFFAKCPSFCHKFLYKFSNSKQWYTLDEYCSVLRKNIFLHHDLKFGMPFSDKSVDYIYTSHFIEHLFRDEAVQILEEAYRTLKEGGIIRICVPDLEVAIGYYLTKDKEKFLSYFFANSRSKDFGHRYMYDSDLLREMLIKIGFVNVRRCPYREGRIPDVNKLDSRPGDSLHVEAEKPIEGQHR